MEQKYNIFCDKRCLTLISGNGHSYLNSGHRVKNCKTEEEFYLFLSEWLKKQITNDLCLYFNVDIRVIKKLISQKYPEVKAAGGVVLNANNEVLFIFRSGVWDLPKGHVEAGESFEETALREVEEETGLGAIHLLKELTTTRHFYLLKGKWEIKMTKWFLMQSNDKGVLTPQISEGIEKAEWISKSQLDQVLKNSFRSVQESLEFDAIYHTEH
jgi:8-oxo-dGTP pyrophosphatase MutT (NUDIX family)